MNYGGMDLPGAQFVLQASTDGYMNGNGNSNSEIQHGDFLEDLKDMPSSLENVFDSCFAREYFIPQMTARPLALPPAEGDKSDSQLSAQPSSHDNTTSGVGAGPLPADFGMPSTQDRNSNGPLDFTKRRNWSQRIIEEIRDLLQILTPDGRMIYLSPSSDLLTGYTEEELRGKFIIDFIHTDDSALFLREFNESIASGNPLRLFYRFRKKDQTYTIFETHGHPHMCFESGVNGNISYSNICRGYFIMARPYLTKHSSLLDSFLEHKIENQRLLKRIEQLRKEEEIEEEAQQKWLKQLDRVQTNQTLPISASNTSQSLMNKDPQLKNHDTFSMPPPARPSNAPLTKKALEESTAGFKPDSLKDKMARYEGVTGCESIEMLTGLRYRDGERSFGISTGAQSPVLIKGDAGISVPLDKEIRGEKKRKLKILDEYVCTDCGTLDSPEWRKGPSGPKTLCNACGLRWAKREKKRPSIIMPESTAGTGESDSILELS